MEIKIARLSLILFCGIVLLVSSVNAGIDDKPAGAAWGIKRTRHNLSNWGPVGNVHAVSETEICKFCHAPHNADSQQTPLWGHADQASVTFTMASTAHVAPGKGHSWVDNQPTGISKQCLSCHDGTVAIGALANGSVITVTGAHGGANDKLAGTRSSGGGLTSPPSPPDYGYIGTNLRGGHVISFNYDGFYTNADPSTQLKYRSWPNIKTAYLNDWKHMFDRNGKMQCHSCHDPHTDWCDDTPPGTIGGDPLWRLPCGGVGVGNRSVCDVCHTSAPSGGFKNYSF